MPEVERTPLKPIDRILGQSVYGGRYSRFLGQTSARLYIAPYTRIMETQIEGERAHTFASVSEAMSYFGNRHEKSRDSIPGTILATLVSVAAEYAILPPQDFKSLILETAILLGGTILTLRRMIHTQRYTQLLAVIRVCEKRAMPLLPKYPTTEDQANSPEVAKFALTSWPSLN